MKGKKGKKTGTEGIFEVEVTGAHIISFNGDANEMKLFRDPEPIRDWNLVATRRLPEDKFEGINIVVPGDLPCDEKEYFYPFAQGATRLHFSAFHRGGVETYVAIDGGITVKASRDGTRLDATFNANAEFGSTRKITLTNGAANLSGLLIENSATYPAEGEMQARFTDAPFPFPSFEITNDLSIYSSDFSGHLPDYRIYIGNYYEDGIEQTRNILAIVIDKSVTGPTHSLADNDKVQIQYNRINKEGLFTAHAGELQLDNDPTDDKGSGRFTCLFKRDDIGEFKVEGSFHLSRIETK